MTDPTKCRQHGTKLQVNDCQECEWADFNLADMALTAGTAVTPVAIVATVRPATAGRQVCENSTMDRFKRS
jgi:lipoprotein signal peptidase